MAAPDTLHTHTHSVSVLFLNHTNSLSDISGLTITGSRVDEEQWWVRRVQARRVEVVAARGAAWLFMIRMIYLIMHKSYLIIV